jgi:hypothetical protein
MMTLTAKRIEHLAHELVGCSDQDITTAIKRYDPEDKIAVRLAIELQREAQGIQAKAAEPVGRRFGEQDGSWWLRRLNIDGPIDVKTLEAKMSEAALGPELRIAIKCEAMERRWLSKGLGYRISAAELATDQVREDRLASDHAVIDYGLPPLSLEMFGLFNRASLQENHTYAPHEVDELLRNSDLTTLQRMALRQELHMRRQVRASKRDTLDEKLEALRQIHHQRRSLEGQSARTMRASAEPSSRRILRDQSGKPIIMKFVP